MKAAFVVTEPSGKVYSVYENGRIEGFAEGSLIFNRIPGLIRSAVVNWERKTMSIQYCILKACDFSPRHKSALVRALNDLSSPTVVRCAALLRKKCEELSIADFPNPFPRGESEFMLWEEIFLGRTPLTDDKPVQAAGPPKAWPEAWKSGDKTFDEDGVTEDGKPHSTPPQTGPGEEPLDYPETETITAANTGPLEEILGDSTDAGQQVPTPPGLNHDDYVQPTPPTNPVKVENAGQGTDPNPGEVPHPDRDPQSPATTDETEHRTEEEIERDDAADVVDMQTNPDDVEPPAGADDDREPAGHA